MTTDLDLRLRDLVPGDAVLFAAMSVVLFVTGAVSGIAGVLVLGAITTAVAIALTAGHTAKTMVTPASQA